MDITPRIGENGSHVYINSLDAKQVSLDDALLQVDFVREEFHVARKEYQALLDLISQLEDDLQSNACLAKACAAELWQGRSILVLRSHADLYKKIKQLLHRRAPVRKITADRRNLFVRQYSTHDDATNDFEVPWHLNQSQPLLYRICKQEGDNASQWCRMIDRDRITKTPELMAAKWMFHPGQACKEAKKCPFNGTHYDYDLHVTEVLVLQLEAERNPLVDAFTITDMVDADDATVDENVPPPPSSILRMR
jgi:hypothetical protein